MTHDVCGPGTIKIFRKEFSSRAKVWDRENIVIIPDHYIFTKWSYPNPKNEQWAIAGSHRIGQKREVRVIYLEAVVKTISSYQKEDELRIGGTIDSEDDLAGKDRYMGSVESLVHNNIQQYKIDMADEVINADRFD